MSTPTTTKLPDFVLSDLYKNQLVIINDSSVESAINSVQEEIHTKAPEFLGSNQKKITILLSDNTSVFLNDQSLQFLSAILAACKLNLGDVAIVNFSKQTFSYQQLKGLLSPQYIIVFNLEASILQTPFNVPLYQVQAFDDCQFLFAASLDNMLGESKEAKLEKSKLWLSLKKMFNIS